RTVLELHLKDGLKSYGKIHSFEMQHFMLMPDLCMGKVFAVITLSAVIVEDLIQIPHTAVVFINRQESHLFHITVDFTPPICTFCHAFGHKAHTCPTKGGITQNEILLDAMGSADIHYEQAIDTDAAFLWGMQGCYIQVNPVSPQDHKKAKHSHRAAAKAAAMVASVILPAQTQDDIKSFAAETTCESVNQSDWVNQPEDLKGESDLPEHYYQASIETNSTTHFPPKFLLTPDDALQKHSNSKILNKSTNAKKPTSKLISKNALREAEDPYNL
ncbi:hypothetical protein L0F63_006532, partial [Massospora cicadina]